MIRRPPRSTLFSLHDALPISFWDWHPTRREMLVGTRFGDAQQLHRVRLPGGARTQLTFLTDPDRKSTRLNSSHSQISYAVFCLKKKNNTKTYAHTCS